MPAPRPILKGLFLSLEPGSNPLPFSSCSTVLDSPHVHFPPTPTLTSTEITHSSFIYDRAPIVVTPNVCALPERGGRNLIGSSSYQAGLGYFHPHAQFQVDAVRVERDSSETVTPAIFSASVTVGNVNDCGSVELFRKKWSGPMYEYDPYSSHDQDTQTTRHVISSLILDPSSTSESSDLGVFCSPQAPYVTTPIPTPIPTPSSASTSTSPSSIPHPSLYISPRNTYDTLTAPQSPSSTSNNNAGPSDKHQHKKKTSLDVGAKKRRKNREYTHHRTEGGSWTQLNIARPGDLDATSRELELEGCLGGF